jgi:hypothetical protein
MRGFSFRTEERGGSCREAGGRWHEGKAGEENESERKGAGSVIRYACNDYLSGESSRGGQESRPDVFRGL